MPRWCAAAKKPRPSGAQMSEKWARMPRTIPRQFDPLASRRVSLEPRKQPALWPYCLPPSAQQLKQVWRQHDVAVFAALALLHADDHALAVDVFDLERDYFGGAQPRPIGHAQRCLVLEPRRRLQQARYLLRTEHHRQLAGLMNEVRVLDDCISPERDPEKEPQRRGGAVDDPYADAARSHV